MLDPRSRTKLRIEIQMFPFAKGGETSTSAESTQRVELRGCLREPYGECDGCLGVVGV
jgi:hypothetical protein